MQARERFTGGNDWFIQSVAFIALLVGAIGIVTTLYNAVNERISEIGTIKAIGAARIFILLMFLFEALMIGLIGSTLGVVSGVFGAYAISSGGGGPRHGFGGGEEEPNLKSRQYSFLVILQMSGSLSVALSVIAGLYPAWKASGLSPVLALKR